MKRMRIAVLLTVFLCCACGAAQAGTPTPPAAGTILFEDHFDQPRSGWGVRSDESGVAVYDDGGLRLLVRSAYEDVWSTAGQTLANVRVDAVASRKAGPSNNVFGLICRYIDRQNFYAFLFTSDGYYGIAERKEDEFRLIGANALQYSDALAATQDHYWVGARCDGNELALYLNGNVLQTAPAENTSAGDIGVLAGAFEQANVEIRFDDFTVRQP